MRLIHTPVNQPVVSLGLFLMTDSYSNSRARIAATASS